MANYKVPVYTNANSTKSGEPFSEHITNETIYVHNSMSVLFGMPDMRYRVKISGMQEVDAHSPIEKTNQFKVDYKNTGNVYFHPEFDKTSVVVTSYYSRGLQYFPASRIWTKIDGLGNVLQTLEDVIDLLENVEINKDELRDIIQYAEEAIQEGHRVMVDMYNSIDDAKETRNNLEKLVLESKDKIRQITALLEEGQRLEGVLTEFYEVFANVKEIQAQLEKLYEDSLKISNTLKDQIVAGNGIIDSLKALVAQSKDREKSLLEANEKAKQTNTLLNSTITDGEAVTKALKAEQETGKLLSAQLSAINNITKDLHTTSQKLNSETRTLLSAGDKLLAELSPIVSNGQKLLPQLTSENQKADSNIIVLQKELGLGNELLLALQKIQGELKGLQTSLGQLSSEAQDIEGKLKNSIAQGATLTESINVATAKGEQVLDKLTAIIEGTDYESILKKVEGLEKSKADKAFVESELSKKADSTYVDTQLGTKANKKDVDTQLNTKADKTFVDTQLNTKANKKDVDAQLNTKANKDDISKTITQKEEPVLKVGDQWHKIVD